MFKQTAGEGVCPGKWTQIPENEVHYPGFVWKNYGMYDKVKYGKFSNSRADNSDSCAPITLTIELIRDLMFTYIWTKFGADWLIFVDARV